MAKKFSNKKYEENAAKDEYNKSLQMAKPKSERETSGIVLSGRHPEIERLKKLAKLSGQEIGTIVIEIVTDWNKKNSERILKQFMQ